MKLKRVEHVAIAVNDMAKSMKMLQDTLGIEMEYEEKIGETRLAMFPVGETYLELLSSNASAQDSRVTEWIEKNGQSLFHLCFEVDDIDKTCGRKELAGPSTAISALAEQDRPTLRIKLTDTIGQLLDRNVQCPVDAALGHFVRSSHVDELGRVVDDRGMVSHGVMVENAHDSARI